MAKKSGLGKGLGALIPNSWEETEAGLNARVVSLPVENIHPNPHQPRKTFNEEALLDLADSIREHGILQPLIVITAPEEGQYLLIAGERRLRASKIAGLNQVPAIVRTATEQQQLEFAIIENVQREDLNPMERAQAYQNLIDQFSMTHEDIAHKVGRKRTTISNTLRLLNLPPQVQNALANDSISEGHARALLSLNSPRAMESALETILSLGLNVRQTEALVSKLLGKVGGKQTKAPTPPEVEDLENRLRSYFNTRVALSKGKTGGSITIYFYSDEELNSLSDKLGLYD